MFGRFDLNKQFRNFVPLVERDISGSIGIGFEHKVPAETVRVGSLHMKLLRLAPANSF
jgi:hypothetical protein